MKITFILSGYPWKPVGGFRVVYEYGNHLVARGHEVSVVHPRHMHNLSPPPSLYCRLRRRLRIIRNMLLKPAVGWQSIDPRVQMIYVPEPTARYIPHADVVFATAWQTAEYVANYPPSKGRKYYLVQSYETWSGPEDRVNATWRAPLKKVVIAHWLYEKGLRLGVPDTEMRYIPNGIDLNRFPLINDIQTRPKRVAMLYSLGDVKGSPDGLQALQIARCKHADLQAVLFGTTRQPAALPAWIEYEQNPPQDKLVSDIYNGSRVYLCSSWLEGFPLPPAEAMACGCAVVSTDCGGVREYAEHEINALLSPPKDPDALARNLLRLLEDDGLRARLAKAGHERIQDFRWERSTDLLEQFISSS